MLRRFVLSAAVGHVVAVFSAQKVEAVDAVFGINYMFAADILRGK